MAARVRLCLGSVKYIGGDKAPLFLSVFFFIADHKDAIISIAFA